MAAPPAMRYNLASPTDLRVEGYAAVVIDLTVSVFAVAVRMCTIQYKDSSGSQSVLKRLWLHSATARVIWKMMTISEICRLTLIEGSPKVKLRR